MKRLSVILVCAGFLALGAVAAHAYPQNYLSAKLGASVSTDAQIGEDKDPNVLLSDGPISAGTFYFKKDQPQIFVVDFGQVRTFDRVNFGSANAGSDRSPERLKILISNKGPDGPWEMIFEKTDIHLFQVLRLPLVEARWVKFDLGRDRTGALVRTLRIYKGYEHPKLVEVTRLLHERIKPDLPGLEKFYAAADKGDWKNACSELRAYYAEKRKPEDKPSPDYDTSRAQAVADGKIDHAGLKRDETVPIDWSYMRTNDWYEHKNFLNRGSAIGTPAMAYWNTGEKKWAKLFKDVFYDWVDANPKPTIMSGADYPTWRTLDSASRLGWIAHTFPFSTAAEGVDDELWANHLYTIWEHIDYLKNDDFDGGNWLAIVMSRTLAAALEYPEFKDNKLWLEFSRTSFETNVSRDVYPDGKEKEDAPGYVWFACGAMIGTMQALEEAGIEVSKENRDRLQKAMTFIAAVTQPDGNMPMIGDWGGGAPWGLSDAADYLRRDDVKYILSEGKEGTKPDWTSINFPQGEWTIMRSAYDERPFENARHLVIKMSHGGHGHHDILGITNYAYGRELLIDPGIRSYEHADVVRYLATEYHNTITVDGKNQEGGPGKTEKWVSNDGLDYVLGSHDRHTGLVHSRGVVFVKPDYWIVLDSITGEGDHTYDQNWHFKEDAGLTADSATKTVHTSYPSGGNLLMIPVDTYGLTSESIDFLIADGRMADSPGTPSKGWKYARASLPPKTMDLVLYPYNGGHVPNVTVKRLKIGGAPDATALRVDVNGNTDYVFVSRTGAVSASMPDSNLKVDGEIVVIRLSNGKPVRVSGVKVKSVALDKKELVTRDEAEDVDVVF